MLQILIPGGLEGGGGMEMGSSEIMQVTRVSLCREPKKVIGMVVMERVEGSSDAHQHKYLVFLTCQSLGSW